MPDDHEPTTPHDDRTPATPAETVETVQFGTVAPGASRGRRAGRAAAWVAVGALGATVLTGVAFAASRTDSSSTPSPTPTGQHPGYRGGAPGAGPMGGPAMGGGLAGIGGARVGAGGLLHGDVVVKTKTGGTKELLVQNGSVTAASGTSLTVKSTDGFVATWTLNNTTAIRMFSTSKTKATAKDLAVGNTVLVAGTKLTDASGTALLVRVPPTQAQLKKLFKNGPQGRMRMHMRGGPAGQGGAVPSPSASGSTGSTSGQSTGDQLGLDPADLNALGV